MARETIVYISIDGSAMLNGRPDASGGYGLVIELNGAVAELKGYLCRQCDAQTNNRAELRAAHNAVNFLHELAKFGHHKICSLTKPFLNDDRSIDARDIAAIIRTDSTYVLKGATGVNEQKTHKELWESVHACMGCARSAGMYIRFEHVHAHSGDPANERADAMAREMAARNFNGCPGEGGASEAVCTTCCKNFKDVPELACHFKNSHMGRDIVQESLVAALLQGEKNGAYECTVCDKKLKNHFALKQHVTDKHGRRSVVSNGGSVFQDF